MPDIEINIRGNHAVGPALLDGLEDGMDEAGEDMLDRGEQKAKDVVRGADRIWRRKLYWSFRTHDHGTDSNAHWSGSVENFAPHAHVVEGGLTPGNAPPVQEIIEWVSEKLRPKEAEAQERHIGNWDPQLQALAVEYSKGYVLTAFAVQKELDKTGYHGIGFMEAAEQYLRQIGPLLVHRKVEKHMQRELRRRGLA